MGSGGIIIKMEDIEGRKLRMIERGGRPFIIPYEEKESPETEDEFTLKDVYIDKRKWKG